MSFIRIAYLLDSLHSDLLDEEIYSAPVSLGPPGLIAEFYWVSQDSIWFNCFFLHIFPVLIDFTLCFDLLLGCTRLYLFFTGFHWVSLVLFDFYWV